MSERLRPRRRRRHRPPERAAALDPHRGRARDLRADRSRRAHDAGGVRRHPARDPRVPARRASPRTRCWTRRPTIRAVAARYLGDPAFSNLPRKYKTSISGCRAQCTNPEINDISLVGRRPADGEARLRPAGGRRPVDEPDVRAAARARSSSPRACAEVWARRRPRCSASTATGARATTRGSSSW